jgi:adenylate cyclase, class 2
MLAPPATRNRALARLRLACALAALAAESAALLPEPARYNFWMRARREIEIKVRVLDLAATIRKIRLLRARSLGRVLERNTLFDTPGQGLRGAGSLLRLRTETPAAHRGLGLAGGARRAILTAKAPALGSATGSAARFKIKLESEVSVSNPERWPEMLEALGFRAGFRYEKYRSTFVLSGLHLAVDETPVGDFLELEGAPAAIERAARRLGYSPGEYLRSTYWDLYAAECERRGVRPRHMLMAAQKSR